MMESLLGDIFFVSPDQSIEQPSPCRYCDVIFKYNHKLLLYLRNKQYKQLTQANCALKSLLTQSNALAY